ncbi:MAG: substrate-binding domain-containing protein [Gammaproteobacteria bacterium]|nr:substrate-binding domain-containing protein [Gammaproteobacteria bacterium]MDH5594271.1 substrate-binding domain-containing protein [Gammaproteobacteria bacterium]MDH5613579.1 substrate-binding domain-containing protein [Gammaproteobacteria bacterium]
MNSLVSAHDLSVKFSNPDETSKMSKAWIERSVSYDAKLSARDIDIVMVLDQQTYPAFSKEIKEFAKNNNIKIELTEGSCGVSAGGMADKRIDIGGYCCPPGQDDRLPGIEFHTIGIAPIALFVNKDNPINNVTHDEVKKIFSGEIFRWSGLKSSVENNVTDAPIQVVGRLHCRHRPGAWRLILDNEEHFSAGLMEVGTIKDMLLQIGNNKRAIGYEMRWMSKYHDKEDFIKPLKINSVSPDDSNALLSNKYPFYRTYSLAYWKKNKNKNANMNKLISYINKLTEEKTNEFGIIPSSSLKKSGWIFRNNELIGEPG